MRAASRSPTRRRNVQYGRNCLSLDGGGKRAGTFCAFSSSAGVQSGSRFPASLSWRRRFHETENVFPCRRPDLFPDRRHACLEACVQMGSSSERLVSSDVGKRHCDSDNGVLSFRKFEVEQEKLEFAV